MKIVKELRKLRICDNMFLFSAYISAPFQRVSAGKISVIFGKINRKGRRGRRGESLKKNLHALNIFML
jgi:hypothetical protein